MIASSLSRKILIGVVILAIFHFISGGVLVRYLVMDPVAVVRGFEFWRLFTYVLVPGLFGMVMALVAFSVPGEELEQMIGARQFGLLLLMVVLIGSLLHLVLFFGENVRMGGIANPAFFAFVGFVYLFPHSEVRLIFFNIRSWVLLAVMGGLALVLTLVSLSSPGTSSEGLWGFFSSGGLGLLLGGFYFHTRFQKYPFLLRPIRTVERMAGFGRLSSGPHKPAPAQRRAMAQQQVRVRIPFQKPPQRELSDEERLNLILDKIHEKSYDSLSDDEKRFLEDYSGKL